MAESQVSEVAVHAIKSISENPLVILLVINVFLLVVGSLIEPLPHLPREPLLLVFERLDPLVRGAKGRIPRQ